MYSTDDQTMSTQWMLQFGSTLVN